MQFVNELGLLALGSRFKALSDRLYAIADQVYQGSGVGLQGRWFPLLRLLHDRGPSSVGEIAEAIGQTHSAVSQLADKLVREGWLRSRAAPDDRRQRRLALSPKAEQALREVKPVWRAIQQHLAEACESAQIDLLPTLNGFVQLLDGPVAEQILERAQRLRVEAVQIEPFRVETREHFYRLNEDWLRKYFYLEEIDHQVLSHPEREILQPGGAILFARVGDAIVGTCALKQESVGVFELTKMGVDEGYQGLGIGRQLIEGIIDEFRARQGKTLFLETNSKLSPAIRLYESVGFVRQPARKPDSHYQRSDVYMVWSDPLTATRQRRVRAPAKVALSN